MIAAHTLIFGIGLTYQLVTRNRDAIAYRAAVGVAFAAAFLRAWVNVVQLADVTPAAVMYFGVPIVGGIGAAVARLQPNGMARALFATVLAQALILAVALIIGRFPFLTQEGARRKSGPNRHPFRDERQYRSQQTIQPTPVFLNEPAGSLDYVAAAA